MENKLQLFNTLTRKVDTFVPNVDGKVNMYTCGPTVYHFAHIGNLRSYLMEDVLEKTLTYLGYDVKRVMNITDVGHLSSDGDTGEDKMLKGAKREHKTVMEIAKFYTDAFKADCAKLNIKWPSYVEPATNCIPEFINMIKVLLEKGYAYEAGGNIYFDTSKIDNYYVFGSQNEDELKAMPNTMEKDSSLHYEFDDKKQIGVIAQEVETILPELVSTDNNGYKAVDYSKLTPVLIEAMKEQQAIIESQQKEIDELKAQMREILEKLK